MIDEIRPFKERPGPWRLLVFALLGWLVSMIQVGFLGRLPLLGAPIPLLAAVCVLVAWKYGAASGAVLGVVGGLTLDVLSAHALALSPLLLVAFAIYTDRAAARLFDHPLSRLLAALPPYAVWGAVTALRAGSLATGAAALLGAILATVLLSIPGFVRLLRR